MDMLKNLAKQFGFCPQDKTELLKNLAVKLANLAMGILFVVLRNKMKAKEKKGWQYFFTFMAVSSFINVITASATGISNFDPDAADDDDFIDVDESEDAE